MSQVVPFEGKYYRKGPGGEWQEVSKVSYDQQQAQYDMTREMGAGERFLVGAGHSFDQLGSGARQLTYGDPAAEQQYRREQAELYHPFDVQGGAMGDVGEFTGSASSALLPGGLGVQAGIGGAQGAAEQPDTPLVGAGIGVAATFAGDWLGKALGRFTQRLKGTTESLRPVDADWQKTITDAEGAGAQFTPGQRSGRAGNIDFEKRMSRRSQAFSRADEARRFANQQKVNEMAAQTLGYGNRARITDQMLGEVTDKVGKAYDAIANNLDSPVFLDGMHVDDILEGMGEQSQGPVRSLLKKYGYDFTDEAFEGLQLSGKEFNSLRNVLAKQMRSQSNIVSGVADDMSELTGLLDDSLMRDNPYMADQIQAARKQWKALKIIESTLQSSGAQKSAAGEITPAAAYRQLARYDKGGFSRGRNQTDPFYKMIKGLAAAGEGRFIEPPSPKEIGLLGRVWENSVTGPLAEDYLQNGDMISRYLLGFGDDVPNIPGSGRAGFGVLRGLLEEDSDDRGLMQ